MTDVARAALVRLVRDEGRRVLATLVRLTGDLQLAEDAVQGPSGWSAPGRRSARPPSPYRVPERHELPDRLRGVSAVVHLLFNEGYAATSGEDPVRVALTDEAIWLARLLHGVRPDESAVIGLLALVLLQDSRRSARVDAAGWPVLLAQQDRSRWDNALIAEGVRLVGVGFGAARTDPIVSLRRQR